MKILSWNIQWCRGCDGVVSPQRIIDEIKRLGDFDVICLQEVASGFADLPGSSGEDQFALLAAGFPGYQALPGVAVDFADADGARKHFGNLLLTRLPLLRGRVHALPWPKEAVEPTMPRVLIEATVKTPIQSVRVLTTHLEYYSAEQRTQQIDAIRRIHAEACQRAELTVPHKKDVGPFAYVQDTAAAVLLGDFNLQTTYPEYARMLAAPLEQSHAFLDAWTVRHPAESHPLSFALYDRSSIPEPYACDFAFISTNLEQRLTAIAVDQSSRASDHQAVMITLDI